MWQPRPAPAWWGHRLRKAASLVFGNFQDEGSFRLPRPGGRHQIGACTAIPVKTATGMGSHRALMGHGDSPVYPTCNSLCDAHKVGTWTRRQGNGGFKIRLHILGLRRIKRRRPRHTGTHTHTHMRLESSCARGSLEPMLWRRGWRQKVTWLQACSPEHHPESPELQGRNSTSRVSHVVRKPHHVERSDLDPEVNSSCMKPREQ